MKHDDGSIPLQKAKRWSLWRWWWVPFAFPCVLLAGLVATSTEGFTAMGTTSEGTRLLRITKSPQYRSGKFQDVMHRQEPQIVAASKAWFFDGSEYSAPTTPPPVLFRKRAEFEKPPTSGLRITWLGHSTLLVEIDGLSILVDPVFGENAAPFWWMGIQRFFPPPLPFSELPELDAIVISHDHYDHLDYPTMLLLRDSTVPILVPLGIGAHLEHWGLDARRFKEFDWWDEITIKDVRLVAAPARHFSGRGLTDREQTLWCGWAFIGPQHRAYYTGDTAMFPGFKEIGKRLGPFDVTMVESGAYNQLWADVHLGPEQAVQAHQMLGGKLMIPVHWGMFDLALHSWTEPMERILVAAQKQQVRVATPRPGESIDPLSSSTVTRWWPKIPGQTAEEAPVISSGL